MEIKIKLFDNENVILGALTERNCCCSDHKENIERRIIEEMINEVIHFSHVGAISW